MPHACRTAEHQRKPRHLQTADRRLGLRTHDDEAVPEYAPHDARAAVAGAVAEVPVRA
jgi:hypothetical protein